MTNEHLRLLLDEEDDCRLLHGAAELLAQASVPGISGGHPGRAHGRLAQAQWQSAGLRRW